jgi:hypothetical protein
MARRLAIVSQERPTAPTGGLQQAIASKLPDPAEERILAEERRKNPITLQPLFIWIKDKNEMMAFAKAFVRKLREDGLNVVSDGAQTDPHPKYALEDSCEVFLSSGSGLRRPGELAIISVYRDGEGDQARLVMKVDAAYSSAFKNLTPALVYAMDIAKPNIMVLRDGTFDFDNPESGPEAVFPWSGR